MPRAVSTLVLLARLTAGCGRSGTQSSTAEPAAAPGRDGPPSSLGDWADGAMLFDNLGVFHRRISTSSSDAQQYFDQGMRLLYVRHQLGAVLLAAGRAREAEAVYQRDLAQHPHNGWALFGLAQALRAEGRENDAAAVDREFTAAWAHADMMPTSSAF